MPATSASPPTIGGSGMVFFVRGRDLQGSEIDQLLPSRIADALIGQGQELRKR